MKLLTSPSPGRALSLARTPVILPRQSRAVAIHFPARSDYLLSPAPKREVVAPIIKPPQKDRGEFCETISRDLDERPALLVSSSIKVNSPVEQVYEQWLKFGEIPHFMCGAVRGGGHGESRMVWRIEWAGGYSQWEAEVCEQIPCISIAWRNEHGRPCAHSGSVSFSPISESVTRITVSLEFALEDPPGKTAFAVEVLASRVERHLMCFQNCGACGAGPAARRTRRDDGVDYGDWTGSGQRTQGARAPSTSPE